MVAPVIYYRCYYNSKQCICRFDNGELARANSDNDEDQAVSDIVEEIEAGEDDAGEEEKTDGQKKVANDSEKLMTMHSLPLKQSDTGN